MPKYFMWYQWSLYFLVPEYGNILKNLINNLITAFKLVYTKF